MRILTRTALVTAVLAAGFVLPMSAASADGCVFYNNVLVCINGGGGPGGPGSGGGTSKYTCTYAPLGAGIAERMGLGPAPKGDKWELMTCPGKDPGPAGGEVVLVSKATGVPAVTPLQLLQIAIGDLYVPALSPGTAPPRGKDGLVGLPEWFWVPRASWHRISVTVAAGPVWATATAIPAQITFYPGGGLVSATCTGPGRAYDRKLTASAQHSNCSYTYGQPSAGQPGNAYQAQLTVTWTISWTGSGGAGGLITNAYHTTTPFPVRVAQAEALVTTP